MTRNKLLQALVVLYFCLFPFGQLGRFVVYSYTLHLTDIIVGFIAFVYLVFNFTNFRQKIYKGTLGYYLIGFIILAGLSLLINLSSASTKDVVRGFLYLIRYFSYTILFFAILYLLQSKVFTKSELLKKLKFAGLLTALFALIQYFIQPDARALKNFGWDDHYFRSIGTFLDSGFLGIILVLFTLILFSQEWRREELKTKITTIFLSLTTLVMTFSRSSILALLTGLFIINIVRRKLLLTSAVLVYVGVCLYFIPKPGGEGVKLTRSSTIYSRVDNFNEFTRVGLERPLFGQGFNLINRKDSNDSIDNSHSKFGVDSSFLFVFITTGVVGLSAFLFLIFKILKVGWKQKNSVQGVLLICSLSSILIHSLFQNSLFYPWVLGWLMILLAICHYEEQKSS